MKKGSFISFENVTLDDGFWKARYDLNKNVSLGNVRLRFEETGRFDALRFNFLKNGREPHVFFDSDVAKWMEGVAYLAQKDPASMQSHLALCEELICAMEAAQREDGYLNSNHQQINPKLIFRDRGRHELYCAGHLIEAAIAYHKATGKDRFLSIMEKYCDCIERIFLIEKSAAFTTPGHEEIELALFKLYRHTGKEKYRNMAEFFLSERGKHPEEVFEHLNARTWQDDADIYRLKEAHGHSVRALYFYSGVADMARERGDEALYENLESVFEDITERKMYVTGGVGSTRLYEGFTVPYDLPNHTAYTESCASIAMMYFASRMRRIARKAKYGDAMERVLYNGLLSSTSLSGKAFFYENPLEISLPEYDREVGNPKVCRERLPIKERVEVFSCSCCPPNINRFFGELGSYVALCEEDGVCIEQYISSTLATELGTVTLREQYAIDGKAEISSENYCGKTLILRIPTWARGVRATLDGKEIAPTVVNDYASIPVPASFTLSLDFGIAPRFVAADPRVRANAGRISLAYGPLVYCMEGVDNGEYLNEISVSPAALKEAETAPDFHGFLSITLPACRDNGTGTLYFDAAKATETPIKAKFIPYYAFANRGESDMLVWVRRR